SLSPSDNTNRKKICAQYHQAGAGQAGCRFVDHLSSGLVSIAYIPKPVINALCKTDRAVFQTARKDVCRRAPERKNRIAHHAGCPYNAVYPVRNGIPVLISSLQRLLPGVVTCPLQELTVDIPAFQLLCRHAVGPKKTSQRVR